MKLYQDIAKFYDLLYSYRDYDSEARFLLRELGEKEGARILDVACGTGSHLTAIRRMRHSLILFGVDINKEMLRVARKKNLEARLVWGDMRNFRINEEFDLLFCLSSSIQYNLTEDDLIGTLSNFRRHCPQGKIIFDLAYCKERWKEGYTNITANSNGKYDVVELFTSHSKDAISLWNPLYLIKNNSTGKIDMYVDQHRIRIYGIDEMKKILKRAGLRFRLKYGFEEGEENGTPIFIARA
ncbi:class I SAM-dependent methyltransferase [Candidatus Pacearchaeota archaeon]|nr:class I SAM-dependent methyltransferase [Candidatus Pacearchaeota archaeon]